MKALKRLFRRLFQCDHKELAYMQVKDGNRMRTIWKCTKCGKERMGK